MQQASGIIKHILNTANKPEEDGQLVAILLVQLTDIVAPLVFIFRKIKEFSEFI